MWSSCVSSHVSVLHIYIDLCAYKIGGGEAGRRRNIFHIRVYF